MNKIPFQWYPIPSHVYLARILHCHPRSSYNVILSLFGRKRHRLLPLAERYSSYTTATGDSNGGLAKQVARINLREDRSFSRNLLEWSTLSRHWTQSWIDAFSLLSDKPPASRRVFFRSKTPWRTKRKVIGRFFPLGGDQGGKGRTWPGAGSFALRSKEFPSKVTNPDYLPDKWPYAGNKGRKVNLKNFFFLLL